MIQTERGESCCKFGVMKKIKSFRLAVIFISVVQNIALLFVCQKLVQKLLETSFRPRE